MENRITILALDPSGSFNEGKGKTGWMLLDYETEQPLEFGQLKAIDYETRVDYWRAHQVLIEKYHPNYLVVEQYRLYKNSANSQVNSELETSKLLGYIEMVASNAAIDYSSQMAANAKFRYSDKILVHEERISIIKHQYHIGDRIVSEHTIDAFRHALLKKLRLTKKELHDTDE